MRFDVHAHAYLHVDAATEARLGDIRRLCLQILARETVMSAQLDNLSAAVARIDSVTASTVTLINGLADQLRNAADDPAKVQQLADDLNAQADALSAAVAANTPAG